MNSSYEFKAWPKMKVNEVVSALHEACLFWEIKHPRIQMEAPIRSVSTLCYILVSNSERETSILSHREETSHYPSFHKQVHISPAFMSLNFCFNSVGVKRY